MFRFSSLALFGIILIIVTTNTAASPPDDPDSRINKTLAVQKAMARARGLLLERNAQTAVEVLEEQLAKVNGNTEYLVLLRDAYRSYIRDLQLAGQSDPARRYLERLCIIDPTATSDVTLRPHTEQSPRKFEPEPPKQSKLPFPMFKLPELINPFVKQEEATKPPVIKPSVIRAQAGDLISDDPFAPKHRREVPAESNPSTRTQELLARGAFEFRNERYAEARLCFEQAYHADQTCLDVCKTQWAYCIVKGVSDAMNQPGAKLLELKQQVEGAINMAPGNMMEVGQALLQRLDQRAQQPNAGAPQVTAAATKVSHRGKNREGWDVAETPHFRIFHRKDAEYAERVALIAEGTRSAMYRKWFGIDGTDWQLPCELILHPTGAEYTQMTGVPGNSPGHSRIEADPSGRVISRRMDLRLDINGMMDTVLPHEATHVVLAGMFGAAPVPRWADEGMAVLSEPDEKIDQHRRNLLRNHKDGLLFGLKELMELKEYPHPRRIGAFYAQSVVLVEFLTQRRSPRVFTEFVNDGMRHGYETSLQRHYNLTFTQLDQIWQQQILSNSERFAATK